MGTWMTHLRIAGKLMTEIDGLDAEMFALGNLGPDCNIPNEDWSEFDPPAAVTHFKQEESEQCRDLDFYRQHLSEVSPQADPQRFSFLLGYFFHLITDNLWHQSISCPLHDKYADAFAANPDFIWEVKRDWYGLDFRFIRQHPDDPTWHTLLTVQKIPDHLDFLPSDAIEYKLNHIWEFYQRQDERVQALFKRPYEYLTQQEMDSFIEESVVTLMFVYRSIWSDDISLEGMTSVFEFLR